MRDAPGRQGTPTGCSKLIVVTTHAHAAGLAPIRYAAVTVREDAAFRRDGRQILIDTPRKLRYDRSSPPQPTRSRQEQ